MPERSFGWGALTAIGILYILAGSFALLASAVTSVVAVIYIGAMLPIIGVLELISAFRQRRTGPGFVFLLEGVVAIAVVVLFLSRPLASVATLTLVIAAYLLARGLVRGVTAIIERYPYWRWDLAYGILALALGGYIAASWPLSSFWILGTIVAVEIIARAAGCASGAPAASIPPTDRSKPHGRHINPAAPGEITQARRARRNCAGTSTRARNGAGAAAGSAAHRRARSARRGPGAGAPGGFRRARREGHRGDAHREADRVRQDHRGAARQDTNRPRRLLARDE